MKPVTRQCPSCLETKSFRADQKTCGCKGPSPNLGKPELKEQNEVSGNKWNISLNKTDIHTLEQLVEYFEIDLSVWEVERFVANKWEMGYVAYRETTENQVNKTSKKSKTSSEAAVQPLFQVKAWLKKRVEVADAKAEIESLRQFALDYVPVTPLGIGKPETTGNMLEVDISDHHFGKLAWAVETGHQNYDTKIAAQLFKRAFRSILARNAGRAFEEIWFVVGNDLLNSDNAQGTTTRGTSVSTDVRYQKTFSVVRTVIIECIEELRPLTNLVKVIMVSGNHDQLSVWHLGDSLEAYFHKHDDVVIDNSPKYYKYHSFGKVMIMYTHGDKGKRKDYPLLMATEQPEMFGATKFREVHVGHTHTDKVEEYHGVKVRVLSALCPPDAWHAENAYVGNLRSAEAFEWNKEEGLIGTTVFTDTRTDIEAE